MSSRTALLLLAFLLACSQLASLAVAGDHSTDPVHDGHDCVVCVLAAVDDDDPTGVIPSEFVCSSDRSKNARQSSTFQSGNEAEPTRYQPRGPPAAALQHP